MHQTAIPGAGNGGETVQGESFHHGTTGNEFFTDDPFVPAPTSSVPVDETSVTSSSTYTTTSTQSSSDTERTRLTQPHLHHTTHTNPTTGPDVNTRASFVKWTTHLPRESLVLITGTLQRPANAQGKILEASPRLQGVELRIDKLFVVGRVREAPPFKFSDVRPVGEEEEGGVKVSVRNELNNRVFDLRVSSGVGRVVASP
jgi:aspartyl-tRNA synthetase